MANITSSDEAVPGDKQHTSPCHDCPWRRDSIKGWLGGATVNEWVADAHSDHVVACHAVLPRNAETIEDINDDFSDEDGYDDDDRDDVLAEREGPTFQCAGIAIYRRNVCKLPRKPNLILPADKVTVFASPKEFSDHHAEPSVD